MKSLAATATLAQTRQSYDFAVIGAGTFGAWTAWRLKRLGRSVLLLDAYGPGNSRASSGGESRVIRMGYGKDEIYTRWSLRSLDLWKQLALRARQPLFHRTGVLWLARQDDPYALATEATLRKTGVGFERLDRAELDKRFPQFAFGPVTWGMLEPASGALMARRAVQAVVEDSGVEYRLASVVPPSGKSRQASVVTAAGEPIAAATFVFACGPWLPKLFPALLGGRIHPTRQEVFFFGVGPGDRRFSPPSMPVWIDFGGEAYGIPNLEDRGFKLAIDRHGPTFDPDTGRRVVTVKGQAEARRYLARHFPALKDAPIVETRVCQYENTSNGDFLIDRHPEFDNVWLVGGGSGHGFKHGPALGEYVAARLTEGGPVEARFNLATKEKVKKREVF